MTDKRNEFSVLDILGDTLRELHAFQCRVTDAEAITQAAALALERVPEHSVDVKHRLEAARAKSLVTCATTIMHELLNELAALIDRIEGPREDGTEKP